ncbi:hypothetical protein M427DRAFT_56981 [Gonapodya prolifera JEL478]|uniref:Thioredoxin-like fold domain-containing protein n=1 Tax=Gonapodya prolifera (strain JEL478) TaxID=1344416 RepID=A0A139AE92_GONPJ|nr:hypothetical protein M427DRAFT_56981 [Gonapodya prolifera JEL478]|eukprot:KXS15087.1 hypothetical protein M427DRAFT_56981 [Gonapodya prolifera JEL478]
MTTKLSIPLIQMDIDPFYAASVLIIVLTALITVAAYFRYQKLTANLAFESEHKDRVVLYQFKREDGAPSGSPFCTKAETILKFIGAEYDNVWSMPHKFERNKVPVFQYNGKVYHDSQIGYGRLAEDGVLEDLDAGLPEGKQAIGLAFRNLVELQLVPISAYERWVAEYPASLHKFLLKDVPYPIRLILMRTIQPNVKRGLMFGIGRYGQDMFTTLLPDSLKAISTQLGPNKWLLGTVSPTTADASFFGYLATNIAHGTFSPRTFAEIRRHPNIVAYYQRIRAQYWPEWRDPLAPVQAPVVNAPAPAAVTAPAPAVVKAPASPLAAVPVPPSEVNVPVILPRATRKTTRSAVSGESSNDTLKEEEPAEEVRTTRVLRRKTKAT